MQPAVIFCHGFPAIWSSWKAQMEGVARAGFMAIALDMRGYGGSSDPNPVFLALRAIHKDGYDFFGQAVNRLRGFQCRQAWLLGKVRRP
jgi:pimeloyl-ACP methyl ester carboxylesterase